MPSTERHDRQVIHSPRERSVWLRGAGFDSALILGGLCLAVLSGAAILYEPSWFWPILVIDLWVLGYHHVVATFTRLCFDRESYRERRWMIVHLAPAIAAATILLAWTVGIWVIVSIYFYWQWWHYTRQSWGISRAFRRADPGADYEGGWLDRTIFHAMPVHGILLRSSQDHAHFIGLDLWTLPVAPAVADATGWAVAALLALWTARRVVALRRGRLARAHTLYMLTHFAIFGVGYVWTPNITFGWLMINIWHNFQYILFVWMFNNRRFAPAKGGAIRRGVLSYISQSGRMWLYMLTCLAITGAVYGGLLRLGDWLFFAGLSATIVLYQIVNFHHYVVDALIWKTLGRPAAEVRSVAG